MKGILNKVKNTWVIEYKMGTDFMATDGGMIPLHPQSIEEYIDVLPESLIKIGDELFFEMKSITIGPATLDDDFKDLIVAKILMPHQLSFISDNFRIGPDGAFEHQL